MSLSESMILSRLMKKIFCSLWDRKVLLETNEESAKILYNIKSPIWQQNGGQSSHKVTRDLKLQWQCSPNEYWEYYGQNMWRLMATSQWKKNSFYIITKVKQHWTWSAWPCPVPTGPISNFFKVMPHDQCLLFFLTIV